MPRNTKPSQVEELFIRLWPDTGRALGISRSLTYEQAREGRIPTERFGRTYRVPVAWLNEVARKDRGAR
jgi:excisionase family DNA binding protein